MLSCRRLFALLCGVFVALTVFSVPAVAAPRPGGFEWSADFNTRLESRHYSTHTAGTHIVFLGKATGCHDTGSDPDSAERFRVELYTEGQEQDKDGNRIDDLQGMRFVPCAKGGRAVFKNVPAGWAYFVLEPDYRGQTPNRVLEGRVQHP